MFSELQRILTIQGEPRARYTRLYGLLNRICIEQSAGFKSDYATLFSRLVAICHTLGIDYRPADRFRHNARLVLNEGYQPTPQEETADVADLCHFIQQVYHTPIPLSLPQTIRPLKIKPATKPHAKNLRGVITEIISDEGFKCLIEGSSVVYTVTFFEDSKKSIESRQTTKYLYAGANVALLDVQVKAHETDSLVIYMVVLEPDYLLDVTALTATMKPYGASPLNYLINRLTPVVTNKYTLLGNMANQFMDDCINGDPAEDLYDRSLKKNYKQYILDFSCLSNEELGSDFFVKTKAHFMHIYQSVHERFTASDIDIDPSVTLLEPSFICPTLGLRGRLDVMTMDYRHVLELKSGKAMEYGNGSKAPRQEHLLQMMLYAEILRRNFGIHWQDLKSYLFYSVYPLFFNERLSATAIRDALHLRNGIVNLIHQIMVGKVERILPLLTPEHLNQNGLHNFFYQTYLLPQINEITRPLEDLKNDDLLRRYFCTFLTFIEREQFLNKTSDNRPDSIRGFAATWTADLQTKLIAGNILTQLTLKEVHEDCQGGIASLIFNIPEYDGEFIPNFTPGVMIQLYEYGDASANVTNSQLVRGTVTEITSRSITVELSYKQRNHHLFAKGKQYAIEHDATDGPSAQQVRNLFSLIVANDERKDLILGRRAPRVDRTRTLCGTYPERIAPIVLQAKQALDYYLLVGPPGTGKTNLALKSMVKEFLLSRQSAAPASDTTAEGEARSGILLTAYTNRAVDEICSMLHKLAQELDFDYLRIGSKQTCAAEFHGHLLSERAGLLPRRDDARRLIDTIPVLVGTVTTLTNNPILFHRKHFDVAILDEASQILEPQALGLLTFQSEGRNAIDKFILIGDHKQLPAVVMLPESQTQITDEGLLGIGLKDLRNSLFERIHWLENRNGRTDFVGMLDHQGRMHPEICDFVNRHFYENRLSAVPLPHQEETLNWQHAATDVEKFVASTRMGFVQVRQIPQSENIRANTPEAQVIKQLVVSICSLNEKNGREEFSPEKDIGIIVPFRSQIACIRRALQDLDEPWTEKITIDTVECYQGSQRDYILFSTTISENYQMHILSAPQLVDRSLVDRKLNVALTRARKQLFIVGDEKVLNQSPIYRDLLLQCTHFA